MLLQDEADAVASAEQRMMTVITAVCLPGKKGDEKILALGCDDIVCHAFSACGTRFIAADNHGILRYGHVPDRPSVSRQVTFDFETADDDPRFPRDFARAVSRSMEGIYGGHSVTSPMLHYRGYRQWACLALANQVQTKFAAMDSEGKVEVWRLDGCIWRRERVRQCRYVPAYKDGKSSLEWNRDGSELSMTDNYGLTYRFIRKGWFGKRWQQVRIQDAS